MGCSDDSEEEKYAFFQDVFQYINKADSAKIVPTSDKDYSGCDSFSKSWKYELETEENKKTICKEFIKLYKSLSYIKDISKDDPKYKKDCAFINYWVNMKISPNKSNDKNYIQDFSNYMESHCNNIFSMDVLSNLLYDIKGDDFNKINILYNLYVNYDKLKRNLSTLSYSNKTSLLSLSDECYYTYKKAENIHKDQKNIFNEKLKKFSSDYETLYTTFEEKENKFNIYFKRLSDEQINIITTSVLGSLAGFIPFLGILYKFTPMGQLFRSKNKTFPIEYSNNDDEQMSVHQDRYIIKYHSVAE